MAAISEHLMPRRYSVSISTDRALPYRKWNHLGSFYAPTARSAAYKAHEKGYIVVDDGEVFVFSDGTFVRVKF